MPETNFYKNITLITKKPTNAVSELKALFHNKKLCVCDFYVEGCEKAGIQKPAAFEFKGVLHIDHHAPVDVMRGRDITSTTIAMDYILQGNKPLGEDDLILINHTDTDSLLSALIMSGKIPPEPMFRDAAIAADHTGKENLIADVLQTLEKHRDIAESVKTLNAILKNPDSPPEQITATLLRDRIAQRQLMRSIAESGRYRQFGKIVLVRLDRKIDAGLAPAYLPEAEIIVLAMRMSNENPKWWIKVRLGLKASMINLSRLNLPDTGGRWNAISTSRHGGTNVAPEDYVQLLSEGLKKR